MTSKRKSNSDSRAVSALAFNADRPMMRFHDSLTLVKPHSQTPLLRRPERPEQRLQQRRRNAVPGIGDDDHDCALFGFGTDVDLALPPARMFRVKNQVEQDLLQLIRMDPH